MSDADQEIQKTLEEMRKRTEQFQANNGQYSSYSDKGHSSLWLKTILVAVGVVVILILSGWYIKNTVSGSKNPGLETFKNAPANILKR